MSETPLKVAIIGMGVMGKIHYRVCKFLQGIQVSSICDTVPMKGYEEPFYSDVDKLLSKENPDAAIIVVPTPFHVDIALKFINKGIPLLIEKPVADNIADGQKILTIAKENNSLVAIGHVERFNPVVKTLKEELTGKEIYSISINRTGPLPPRIGDVGILTDLAVHDIDLIRFISEKSIISTVIHKSQKIHNHFEDNAILSFKLEDEILASITTNWLTPFKKRTIEVATKNAYYEANLISQELTEYCAFLEDDEYVKSRSCHVTKGEPIKNEIEAFANFVKTKEIGNLAGIEDSLLTLKILENA